MMGAIARLGARAVAARSRRPGAAALEADAWGFCRVIVASRTAHRAPQIARSCRAMFTRLAIGWCSKFPWREPTPERLPLLWRLAMRPTIATRRMMTTVIYGDAMTRYYINATLRYDQVGLRPSMERRIYADDSDSGDYADVSFEEAKLKARAALDFAPDDVRNDAERRRVPDATDDEGHSNDSDDDDNGGGPSRGALRAILVEPSNRTGFRGKRWSPGTPSVRPIATYSTSCRRGVTGIATRRGTTRTRKSDA